MRSSPPRTAPPPDDSPASTPMSSLVSDFIINPVLRQARRFSEISRTTLTGDGEESVTGLGSADAVSDSEPAEPPPRDTMDTPESPRSRPISASTQDTRVDETPAAPMVVDDTPRDHLGFPLSPKRTRRIPEDDGMHELRRRILAINARDIPSSDKARLMHDMLLEKYRASRTSQRRESGESDPAGQTWEQEAPRGTLESLMFWQNQLGDSAGKFVLTESDITPTFAPIRQPKSPKDGSSSPRSPSTSQPSTPPDLQAPLGCQHYERNVKLQCVTCKKWYTCRFCHDEHEDHNLIRKETQNMLCMLCATPQKASDVCINCGEVAAQYYCGICKLWENRQSKPIYHCDDCGICRRGRGLGKDFFHCKTCRACITTSIESSHKCIERSTDCDCPICGDYMFTSTKPVVFMQPCGHSIHKKCYDQHMKVSYKCPLCNKSLANMESQFRNLDIAIQNQPMPAEFRDTNAVVLCNDCSGKSTVPYHWLGLKCSICRSYNTVELQILGGNNEELQNAVADRAAAALESASQQTSDLGQPSTATPAWNVATVNNRRRHSSHGTEHQQRGLDRAARSMSPLSIPAETLMAYIEPESDSEDGMLGFWGARGGGDGSSYSEGTDSDGSSSDGLPGQDDDDDDDIVLIGHR